MLRSISGESALPTAGFVSAVLMATLHAPSKLGLTYVATPPMPKAVAELPPVSQITRVGTARAELVTTTAPRATANTFNFFIVPSFLLLSLWLFDYYQLLHPRMQQAPCQLSMERSDKVVSFCKS